MMHIITGSARGVKLETLKGEQTRPTSERAKEAVFSMLQFDLEGRRVLDLFAGSGQMGLEALSRGALSAVLTDKSKDAVGVITRNAQKTKLGARAKILAVDAVTYLARCTDGPFHLVFLDPPYRMVDVYADAIDRLESAGMLSEDVVIVAERKNNTPVKYPATFEIYDTRVYGETGIDFLRRRIEA